MQVLKVVVEGLNLSVKCSIEQNVTTSKLNHRFPVLEFLAPAYSDAASLCEPCQGSLNDPSPCRITLFTGYGTRFNERFTTPSAMLDMGNIAFLLNKLVHIVVIISLVGTQVLLFLLRTLDHNRDNQLVCRPLVMLVGASDVDCQRHPPLIHQQVQFRALLASIRRVLAGFTAAKRCRNRLAVNRLPLPFDLAPLVIELDHKFHDASKDAVLLPGLKPLMQHTAGDAKPVFVNSFPLATRPQHIPDAVQYSMIIGWWAASSAFLGLLGKQFFNPFPQRFGHLKVIDIFRFLVMIFRHGVLVGLVCLVTPISTSYTTFSRLI